MATHVRDVKFVRWVHAIVASLCFHSAVFLLVILGNDNSEPTVGKMRPPSVVWLSGWEFPLEAPAYNETETPLSTVAEIDNTIPAQAPDLQPVKVETKSTPSPENSPTEDAWQVEAAPIADELTSSADDVQPIVAQSVDWRAQISNAVAKLRELEAVEASYYSFAMPDPRSARVAAAQTTRSIFEMPAVDRAGNSFREASGRAVHWITDYCYLRLPADDLNAKVGAQHSVAPIFCTPRNRVRSDLFSHLDRGSISIRLP